MILNYSHNHFRLKYEDSDSAVGRIADRPNPLSDVRSVIVLLMASSNILF